MEKPLEATQFTYCFGHLRFAKRADISVSHHKKEGRRKKRGRKEGKEERREGGKEEEW